MEKLDILELLSNKNNKFYNDDFDMLISELEIGDYDSTYVKKCKELINQLKHKSYIDTKQRHYEGDDNLNNFYRKASQVNPNESSDDSISITDKIKLEIETIRKNSRYLKSFVSYVKSSNVINEKFINDNFDFFIIDEINELMKTMDFSEEFLERYFNVLSHDMLSKYQTFSEEFFMKHFIHINAKNALQNKNNIWSDSNNRSSKFETFLRLKGISTHGNN